MCFEKPVEPIEGVRLDSLVLFELHEEMEEGLEIVEEVGKLRIWVVRMGAVELVEGTVPELKVVDIVVGLVRGVL